MANWGEGKNFGNSVAEIQQKWGERKRKRGREKAKEFRQHCYRNSSAQDASRSVKKKSNCGNAIAEKGKKNFVLAIVAMPLPKMEKKNDEICEWVKKKVVTYTIFSQ